MLLFSLLSSPSISFALVSISASLEPIHSVFWSGIVSVWVRIPKNVACSAWVNTAVMIQQQNIYYHGLIKHVCISSATPQLAKCEIQSLLTPLRHCHSQLTTQAITLSHLCQQLTHWLPLSIHFDFQPKKLADSNLKHCYQTHQNDWLWFKKLLSLQQLQCQWHPQAHIPTLIIKQQRYPNTNPFIPLGFYPATISDVASSGYYLQRAKTTELMQAYSLSASNQFHWPYPKHTTVLIAQPQWHKPLIVVARHTAPGNPTASHDDHTVTLSHTPQQHIILSPHQCLLHNQSTSIALNKQAALECHSNANLTVSAQQHSQQLCKAQWQAVIGGDFIQRLKLNALLESAAKLVLDTQHYQTQVSHTCHFIADTLNLHTHRGVLQASQLTIKSKNLLWHSHRAPLKFCVSQQIILTATHQCLIQCGHSVLKLSAHRIELRTPLLELKAPKIQMW